MLMIWGRWNGLDHECLFRKFSPVGKRAWDKGEYIDPGSGGGRSNNKSKHVCVEEASRRYKGPVKTLVAPTV